MKEAMSEEIKPIISINTQKSRQTDKLPNEQVTLEILVTNLPYCRRNKQAKEQFIAKHCTILYS